MRTLALSIFALSVLLVGCATGTGGVVQTGSDSFMLGGQGGYFDLSGSAVKAKYIQEASRFCEARRGKMQLITSSGQDSGFGTPASAEVQFKCIAG